MLARVAPLSAPARRVLDAAAIVPGTVDLPLLEALAGDAMAHLEECLSCGVLGAAGSGRAFRHELARVAVEETLAPDQRLALHRPARSPRSPSRADPARCAYHAEGAGDADAVLRFAPAAAERAAAAGAHREAAAQYAPRPALRRPARPAERAELLERRSHECYVADQPDEAVEELRHALECHRRARRPPPRGRRAARALEHPLVPGRQLDGASAPATRRSRCSSRSGRGPRARDGLREHGRRWR